MTYPTLHITKGPGQRALEEAFLARDIGARAPFTIFVSGENPMVVKLRIYNFNFTTCLGPNYKVGGDLPELPTDIREKLPPFNFISVDYNTDERTGEMTFSNAE